MKLLPLSDGGSAKVDDQDFMHCLKYTWSRHSAGYAHAYLGEDRWMLLHKFIASRLGLGGEIDHKNRDRLDCQRHNLRAATRTQNNANSGLRSDNTTGIKGVSFDKRRGLYQAVVSVAGKRIWLGYFPTKELAAEAYAAAARKYFGEFANP